MITIILITVGVIVWGAFTVAFCYMARESFMDGEPIIGALSGSFALLLFVAPLAIYQQITYESKNPCVAWGPPETTYMMVGKTMMPVTTTPCIKRQNETER